MTFWLVHDQHLTYNKPCLRSNQTRASREFAKEVLFEIAEVWPWLLIGTQWTLENSKPLSFSTRCYDQTTINHLTCFVVYLLCHCGYIGEYATTTKTDKIEEGRTHPRVKPPQKNGNNTSKNLEDSLTPLQFSHKIFFANKKLNTHINSSWMHYDPRSWRKRRLWLRKSRVHSRMMRLPHHQLL